MAETQMAHRQRLESEAVSGEISRPSRGQAFGLVIGLGGLGAAVWCASLGHPVQGSIIGTVDLVALVTVFVTGSAKKARSLDRKLEAPPQQEQARDG